VHAFSPSATAWFDANFAQPTEAQRRGWAAISAGEHVVVAAPTGSGKTLAAFLWAIDRLLQSPPAAVPGTRVLYVSPLKALVHDVERNLRAPLAGIARAREAAGMPVHRVAVDVRTGDTPQRERQRQAKLPGEILVTTPESLFLILGSRARENLRTVETVIVDELHSLVPTKRGAHLALSLERLSALCDAEPQRVGLSATIEPIDTAAAFLGGDRPVVTVDALAPPLLDLEVKVPLADMTRAPREEPAPSGGALLGELFAQERPPAPPERGIWAAVYPTLLEAIRAHRSTIVFVNSRGLCERLAQRLNELAGEELVLAHHGSVSHDRRREIEEALKAGRVRGIVATSSLELGIDMGAVDLVALVESPGSVARGLQRVGRAGHAVGAVSIGRIYPKFRGDLLECAAIAERMRAGQIEAVGMPRNPLDVLAQQVVAMVAVEDWAVPELARLVGRAAPYRELGRSALDGVLEMLSGGYAAGDFADMRPLLNWDRTADRLTARRGAAMAARLNAGTIPDRGLYGVHLGGDGPRIGELDEEMVFETKPGDNVLLGASTWRVEEVTRDRVIVSPAPGEPGRLPFWRGDGPGRPLELGRALGAMTRRLAAMPEPAARDWLRVHGGLDAYAAGNLVAYLREQRTHTGTLPTDRSITVERFRDELGDWRICLLSPFGSRVHAPWAIALQQQLSLRAGFDVQVMYTDDGIVLRFADMDDLPEVAELFPAPEDVEDRVVDHLPATAMFAALFRENAARALLMPRRSREGRRPLWAQRLKAQALMATVQRYPAFPMILETYRQALSEVFDLAALREVLGGVRAGSIRVEEVETASASPFARSLVFAYVAAYIYEQDAPLAERKAQALTLDRNLLAELLGQVELRQLIDPGVLSTLEAELQHLDPSHHADNPDALHDLLRRLGDLTEAELAARSRGDPSPWLAALRASGRVFEARLAGERRWFAAEDAGLYRDAVGLVPPPGLPEAFLDPVADPLERLLLRYARVNGPFTAAAPARRFGLQPGQIEPVLKLAAQRGDLVYGEIRPEGTRPEWCDAEVMRRLRRRTLGQLRQEIAPVDAAALGVFLPRWHGVGATEAVLRSSAERLLDAVRQLEGLPLPWSVLGQAILPMRVPGYRQEDLDLLAATGEIVWVGRGALGARDGRVALYTRPAAASLLAPEPGTLELDDLHEAILTQLGGGASFVSELERACAVDGTTGREAFRAALWDLVWSGLITNDTLGPLRSLAAPARRRGGDRLAGGRWSLVRELVQEPTDATERLLALGRSLLRRYGVVSREVVRGESLPGGYGPVYQVLKGMEETGRIRRGYFVEGLSGAQFAEPGAVDRLRAARPEETPLEGFGADDAVLLSAVDPANPYGAMLSWPGVAERGRKVQPRRVAGAWVVLLAGRLLAWLGPGGRQLLCFAQGALAAGELDALADRLHEVRRFGLRRRWVVEEINGHPAEQSSLADALLARGFERDYKGLAAARVQ
jgi:ATP-dependent Lhr-like helicase